MRSFIALFAVVALANIGRVAAVQRCEIQGGTQMTTFSGHNISVPVACKYHAIKRTECGKWRINVTPGAWMEDSEAGPVVIQSLWMAIQERETLKKWKASTNWNAALRYLEGKKPEPFNKQDGALATASTVRMGGDLNSHTVFVETKDGALRITYSPPDPLQSQKGKLSFKFECFADHFKPTEYPRQLCGEKEESILLPDFSEGQDADEPSTQMFLDVLTNDDVDQVNRECRASTRFLGRKCHGTTDDGTSLQTEVARRCWPLLGKKDWQNNLGAPLMMVKHCINLVCTKYTSRKPDPNACYYLGKGMDGLAPLPGVCEIIRDTCRNDFKSMCPK